LAKRKKKTLLEKNIGRYQKQYDELRTQRSLLTREYTRKIDALDRKIVDITDVLNHLTRE